jgi:hypothetical protein
MKGSRTFQDSIRRTIPSLALVAAVVFWTLCRAYEAGRKAGARTAA